MWNPFAKHLAALQQSEAAARASHRAPAPSQRPARAAAPTRPARSAKATKPTKRAGSAAAPRASSSAYPTDADGGDPADAGMDGHLHVRTNIAEVEVIGQVAVATLTVDELSQGRGVENLAALLQELKETGARHYVLDIQNIQYMDSMCLGCLVETLNEMASSGGRIALASCDQNVQQLFRMTRLDRVFPICRDVMSAMTAVERERV